MKNLFVPYHIAIMAKEKEFNEPCLASYLTTEKLTIASVFGIQNENLREGIEYQKYGYIATAPLYQQIVDWFREKHDIRISLNPAYLDYTFTYPTSQIEEPIYLCGGQYYEALTKAIEEAFKLI